MEQFVKLLTDATLLAAVLGAIAGGIKFWREASEKKSAAQAALFAELSHIERHYRNTISELGHVANTNPLRRQLRWALYGNSIGATNLKDNAILGVDEMAHFLQLVFFIRNTDIFIEELLAATTDPTRDQLQALAQRLEFAARLASGLVAYMSSKNQSLRLAKQS